MNIQRVKAMLLQEIFITRHSVEIFLDIFFIPFIDTIIFGYLSLFLSGGKQNLTGQYVIMGMLLWNIVMIIEYSVSITSLWNIWARNLSNLFITPLNTKEFILASTISGFVKAIIVLILTSALSVYLFKFNIFLLGIFPLLFIVINLALFAFSVGIFLLGLIFRFGTNIQAFAWGIVPIFQPLSAAFYPLHITPQPLQYIAYLFPPTYVFEGARYSLAHHTLNIELFLLALLTNIVYAVFSIIFFNRMFRISKNTGQFARNEA